MNLILCAGDVLLLEHRLPYRDASLWALWRKEARFHLPEAGPEYIGQPPVDDRPNSKHYLTQRHQWLSLG